VDGHSSCDHRDCGGHQDSQDSYGISDVYDRHQAVSLPAEFEVEWDTVTNGNNVQQIIVDIKPHRKEVTKPAGN
jgi:hypothetical protein